MFEKDRVRQEEPSYWGGMRTLVNTDLYCAKIIRMRAGTQSSLEYHMRKQETYVIVRGTLAVGLRTCRAMNRTAYLKAGDVFTIYPGQMHMRIAQTDVVILEISTYDDRFDTHFVEDGRTYDHVEGKQ